MLVLLVVWYQLFDVRLFLGKIMGRGSVRVLAALSKVLRVDIEDLLASER
jgi:hypothetical protein